MFAENLKFPVNYTKRGRIRKIISHEIVANEMPRKMQISFNNMCISNVFFDGCGYCFHFRKYLKSDFTLLARGSSVTNLFPRNADAISGWACEQSEHASGAMLS